MNYLITSVWLSFKNFYKSLEIFQAVRFGLYKEKTL